MSDLLAPDVPGLPDGLTARPLTLADAGAAADLLAAAEAVDDTGEHEDAADLTEEWGGDLVDLARDGRAVLTDEGRLVAWATVMAPRGGRDTFRIRAEGRVHPQFRGRGVGRALLAWQVHRGTEHAASAPPGLPGRLVTGVWPTMAPLRRLLERAGGEVERLFATMERPLDDVPAVDPPSGVELVPFTWDRDDEVRRAHNASFTRHHGSTERDEVAWRTSFTGRRAFRPGLSVLALADGVLTGYVLAYVYDADTRATGVETVYLGQIGVLPQARGRGVASATITAALSAAASAGCRAAALDVDTENTTGAFALYERVGFRVARTHHAWAVPVGGSAR